MNDPEPDRAPRLRQLLEPLLSRGVDFVVVGGVAAIARGSSYPSFDLDVAYARDRTNLVRIVDALTEIGVTLRNAPPDVPFQLDVQTLENGANFTFRTKYGDFDVLGHVPGIGRYDELRSQAEVKLIAGLDVRVASVDHLIAMKRTANRPKDQRMLEELLVIADEERRGDESDPGYSP